MGVWGLLRLLTLLAITGQVRAASLSLFVVAPNMFNVNEDETVSVLVTGRNTISRVTLTVRTLGTNAVHYQPVSSYVQTDKQKIVKVKVDGSKLGRPDGYGRHYVKLRAQCTAMRFDKETYILVSQRTGTVFLQTDKPLYSPKQNIIIRVFALNEERKATNMPVRVELKNPQDVITLRKQGSTEKGYYMTKHLLSDRPLEGNWTVVAYFGASFSESREKKIEVKMYVLPHFQVRVLGLPGYIDNNTKLLEGTVEARYSFAAPVVGYARVICRVVRGNEAIYLAEKKTMISQNSNYKHIQRSGTQFSPYDNELIDGIGAFTLTRRELEDQDSIVNMTAEEAGLQIEATVTEQSTGIRERVVAAACPFTDSPYRVSFEGTAVSFIPGLEFRAQMRVYHVNGPPAKEVPLTVMGIDNRGQTLQRDQKHIDLKAQTDDRGRHHHNFDVSRAASPITVTVKVDGYRMKKQLVVPKMPVTDPEYMIIRPKDTLKPGVSTYSEVRLTEYKNIRTLYYMLLSGGRILEVASKKNVASHIMTLSHDVTYNMTPSVRLVAWYFPYSSRLVSAATTIPVETACRTEAKVLMDHVDGRPNVLKPHDQLGLTFTGSIGANVSLMAVDKSVYFLNTHTQLTRETFFDEFMTRDLGCASGGGMNTTDVFHLAGLTILSNFFETPRREQEGCRSEVRSRRKRSARIKETAAEPADSVCCEAGHGFATNLTTIPSNLHGMRKSCYQESNQPGLSSRKCKNTFVNCCVKKLIERFEKSTQHSRTGAGFDIIEEINFIEDEEKVTPNGDFPDSWMIFSDIQIPSSGRVTHKYSLPSTVTTWVIQAVTMSDTEGMCVAPPVEQVVRKDLFVKLHLPHTVVQGEQIQLAATVYNLLSGEVRVKVGLLGTEESCSNAQVGSWSIKTHTVRGQNSWTARWPFIPMEIGDIPITVRLKSFTSSDTIRKSLNVVPSGDLVVAPILHITQDPMGRLSDERQWRESAGTHSYTALKVTSKQQQINTLTLKLPEDALADTADIKLSLIGDVMTPAVEGLVHGVERYLRKSSGCPAQTMAKLGPTVFAAEYLQRTNSILPAQERDISNKVAQGVRHMHQYRKKDGSFGSVWLTAFALKTFTHARTFTDQVDQKIIRSGFDWLVRKNTGRGVFDNYGIFNHRSMVGTQRRLSSTAYVYIAMMEANVYQRHHVRLHRTMNYLARSALTQNDHFTLAIVSYALALRGHSLAAAVNQRLLSKAKVLPGTVPPQKYWTQGEPQVFGSDRETETAGYGLLAQLKIGNVTESNAIVEWLIRQRYGGPLYRTTQSTVVLLQALSLYSLLAPRDNLHMECTALSTTNNNILKKFDTINNNNRLVQQTFKVTDQLGEAITLKCTGDGVLHAAIETTYYSSKSNDDMCAFTITAIAQPKNSTSNKMMMNISVCTRLKDGANKLSMPMVDVGIGSGFIPVDNTLQMIQNITNEVDFYEVNDRSVVFYLSEIPDTRDLCLNFDVKQDVVVKNVRPVPVNVYAYYEPDKLHCRRFYNPVGGEDSMLQVKCDKEEKYCKCLESACPLCYGYATNATLPMDKKALKESACRPGSSFDHVLKATLVRMEDFGGEIKLRMRIMNVTKEGIEHRDQLQDQERIFTGPAKCPRCPYDEGENYIIMGEDGKVVKNGIREYIIGPKSYLMRLYAKREYKEAGLSRRQRRINRNHKVFLEDMEANGCST